MLSEDKDFAERIAKYKAACNNQSKALKVGDKFDFDSPKTPLSMLIVTGSREVIANTGEPNPFAAEHKPQADDPSDNSASLSGVLRFGKFEFLTCGDLTWNTEAKLMRPNNPLGKVDLYMVTHHGLNVSNNPVLVKASTRSSRSAAMVRRRGSQRDDRDAQGLPVTEGDVSAASQRESERRRADSEGVHRQYRADRELLGALDQGQRLSGWGVVYRADRSRGRSQDVSVPIGPVDGRILTNSATRRACLTSATDSGKRSVSLWSELRCGRRGSS